MSGAILLQGGAELQPACADMDAELVGSAGVGDLVLVIGAATPGADHDRAAARAGRYYASLGTARAVTVAPHPQVDLDGCLAQVEEAAVVVMPGGSPSRLRACLTADGARLGRLLVRRHHEGAALSGASAGAMVLCARTMLPDSRGSGGPEVADGLGLVPGLALVHDDGIGDRGWADPEDPQGPRWGLPEAGGVLLRDGRAQAVGQGSPRLLLAGGSFPVPRDPVSLPELFAPTG